MIRYTWNEMIVLKVSIMTSEQQWQSSSIQRTIIPNSTVIKRPAAIKGISSAVIPLEV